jgi:hypothetical protein
MQEWFLNLKHQDFLIAAKVAGTAAIALMATSLSIRHLQLRYERLGRQLLPNRR